MKINILIVLLFGVLLSMAASESFACRASRDLKHNLLVNFEKEPFVSAYGTGENSTLLPQSIDQCRENAGKHLMLSKGVFMPSLVSDVADISLDGNLPKANICRIENPLFANPLDFDQKKNLVKRQHQFLQECTFINVAELNGRQLRYKTEQNFCKVTPLGPGMVRFEGEYCFLQINPNYVLAITLGVKPECANPQKMRELGLEFGDIEAALNSYVTGDDTGLSTEVDPIGSSKYRITLQAPQSLIPLSEDQGPETPRFPSIYKSEMNMGELKFTPAGEERLSLDMYLSVDNFSGSHCPGQLCTNPSAYNIPVAAEVELYEISNRGKKTLIDGWTTGGIAQGNWKGLMRLPQKSIDGLTFKKDSTYQVVVTMIDPFEDFYIFLKQAEQLLIDIRGANGVAGLDALPSLAPLTDLAGLPHLSGLPNISSADLNNDLEMALSYFKKLGSNRLWPTYYSTLCDPTHGHCFSSGKQKFWNRFTTLFQVGDLDNSGIYEIKNIRLIKENSKAVIFDKNLPRLPRYTCD